MHRRYPGAGNANPARTAGIVALYLGGATGAEIGSLLGITRERVRQILATQGMDAKSRGVAGNYPQAVDPLALVAAIRRRDVGNFEDVRRIVGGHGNYLKRDVVRLGLLPAVQRLFRWRRERRHLDGLLRLATHLGRTPGRVDLDTARRDGFGSPDCTTLRNLFGTLREAQRRAGLTPNPTGRRPKSAPSPLAQTSRGEP